MHEGRWAYEDVVRSVRWSEFPVLRAARELQPGDVMCVGRRTPVDVGVTTRRSVESALTYVRAVWAVSLVIAEARVEACSARGRR